jgi:DNA polymerase III subunit epsilon
MAGYCEQCNVEYSARTHTCLTKKVCQACQFEKDIDLFSVHASSLDGHRHICMECAIQGKTATWETKRITKVRQGVDSEERTANNLFLKSHGYHWRKMDDTWRLLSFDGRIVTSDQAFQEIDHWNSTPGIGQEKHTSKVFTGNIGAWARSIVQSSPLILDTETTGLDGTTEVIDIAIIDSEGNILLNTLIQCQDAIPVEATNVHHITKEMLIDAPTFPDIWSELEPLLTSSEIVIFNAEYDIRMLYQTATRYHLSFPEVKSRCLMLRYSDFIGEPGRNGHARYQKLSHACQYFGIEEGTHRALVDCTATRKVLLKLAELE